MHRGCYPPVPTAAAPRTLSTVRRTFRSLALVALLAAISGSSAAAQDIDSPYRFVETRLEAAMYVGYTGPAEGRFGYGPQGGPTIGGRFGADISNFFGMEAFLAYSSLERDIIDPTGDDGPRAISTATVEQYQLDLRARIQLTGRRSWNGIQPMLYGGIGLRGSLSSSQPGDFAIAEQYRFDTGGAQFAANGGALVRAILGDHWTVRAEAGVLLYRIGTPPGYSEPELDLGNVGQDEWVNAPTFGISLGYRF